MNEKDIIEVVFCILTELDARENGGNCVLDELIPKGWNELCDDAISLLSQLKQSCDNKCCGCKFYVWNDEHRSYVCDIKGCYNYSKYVRFE